MLRLWSRINATATVTPRKPNAPFFVEVQKFRQVWLWVLLAFVVLAQLGVFALATPLAASIAAVISSVLIVSFFLFTALYTEVDEEGLVIRFRGLLVDRRIRFDEIAAFGARTYRPILEYGGWGIRGFSSNRAYNVSGDRGVQLLLTDGKRVLIGSNRADALARAIAEASNREASNF